MMQPLRLGACVAACLLAACAGMMVPAKRALAATAKLDNPFARVFATDSNSDTTADGPQNVYTITVIARDTEFIPNVLKAKAGSKIQIRFRNDGKHPHNMTFQTLPYRTTTVSAGGSTSLDMVAPAPGRYEFYCSVGNHALLGMMGVLKVTT